MKQEVRILHLSDLGFREPGDLMRPMVRALLKTVAENPRPDLIAVSGDIAFSGKQKEYAVAERFLRDLLKVCQLGGDRLLLVPGNHDVDRSKIGALGELVEKASIDGDEQLIDDYLKTTNPEQLYQRLEAYMAFAHDLTGLPNREPAWHRVVEIRGIRLGIAGLCSSLIPGLPFLGAAQLEQHLEPLREVDAVITLIHDSKIRKRIEPFLFKKSALVLSGYAGPNEPTEQDYGRGFSFTTRSFTEHLGQPNSFGAMCLNFEKMVFDSIFFMWLKGNWQPMPGSFRDKKLPVRPKTKYLAKPGSHFRVEAFKSIVDQDLALGTVNVLIGANGSGKSNILEALGVLGAATEGRLSDAGLQARGVRPGLPKLFNAAFRGTKKGSRPVFGFREGETGYDVCLETAPKSADTSWWFGKETLVSDGIPLGNGLSKNQTYGVVPKILPDLIQGDPLRRCLEALRQYAIYSPETRILRGLVPDNQMREPLGLGGGGLAEAVDDIRMLVAQDEHAEDLWEDMLGLVDWMADVDAADSVKDLLSGSVPRMRKVLRFTDRHMTAGKNMLTGHDASEGALYVLFFAVLALHPKAPRWLAVDNADQALNPRLVQGMLRKLCTWLPKYAADRCWLLTLHNPSALDGLPLDDDHVRLFAVNRNNKGHTVVKRVVFTEELIATAREKDWPLSRLWVMGHLGGVPNV